MKFILTYYFTAQQKRKACILILTLRRHQVPKSNEAPCRCVLKYHLFARWRSRYVQRRICHIIDIDASKSYISLAYTQKNYLETQNSLARGLERGVNSLSISAVRPMELLNYKLK